jgi:hypothetical protein
MTYVNFQKIASLMQGQENFLFTFDVTVGSQDLTIAYFTFNQIGNMSEGDTDYKKLKAHVASGDFMMVGHKD